MVGKDHGEKTTRSVLLKASSSSIQHLVTASSGFPLALPHETRRPIIKETQPHIRSLARFTVVTTTVKGYALQIGKPWFYGGAERCSLVDLLVEGLGGIFTQ